MKNKIHEKIIKNNQRYELTLSCIAYGKEVYEFDNYDIDGCLKLLPYIQSQNEVFPIGTALYLSPKVKKTSFAQLYILEKDFNNIKIVYESEGMPFAVYQGRLIGPLKIWKVQYPEYIKVNQTYISIDWPDPEVMIPKSSY